jgi:hypothetical protein
MNSLDNTASALQIISMGATGIVSIYAIWRRLDKRQTETHTEMCRMNDKLTYIENQFGPNGGGLREAVNNLAKQINDIDNRVTFIGDGVAKLSGKFEQHIIEGEQ